MPNFNPKCARKVKVDKKERRQKAALKLYTHSQLTNGMVHKDEQKKLTAQRIRTALIIISAMFVTTHASYWIMWKNNLDNYVTFTDGSTYICIWLWLIEASSKYSGFRMEIALSIVGFS
eukprot:116197_1